MPATHLFAFCSLVPHPAAVYVMLYSVHYFVVKTKMTGFFQTAFYFGYTAMFCLGLSTMCGAVGYLGALAFVRRIFRGLKVD
jgi:transmembrane 9 superfamily protein 3